MDIYLTILTESATQLLRSLHDRLRADAGEYWTARQQDDVVAIQLLDEPDAGPALLETVVSWIGDTDELPSVKLTTTSRAAAIIRPETTGTELGRIAERLTARPDEERRKSSPTKYETVTLGDHHSPPVPPGDAFTTGDSHDVHSGEGVTPPGPVLDPGDDWAKGS